MLVRSKLDKTGDFDMAFQLRFAEQPARPRIYQPESPMQTAVNVTLEFVLFVAFFTSIACGLIVCAGVAS
jgi:hypothetical protein